MSRSICLALAHFCFIASFAVADPCGMVPPLYVEGPASLVRVGHQQTYVFFKNDIETFVIRPGFSGSVKDFGMLIPFPTPPAIRKVPEEIFAHLAATVDPPEVVVRIRIHFGKSADFESGDDYPPPDATDSLQLHRDEVRVLR